MFARSLINVFVHEWMLLDTDGIGKAVVPYVSSL
jgi:hypothetical protein